MPDVWQPHLNWHGQKRHRVFGLLKLTTKFWANNIAPVAISGGSKTSGLIQSRDTDFLRVQHCWEPWHALLQSCCIWKIILSVGHGIKYITILCTVGNVKTKEAMWINELWPDNKAATCLFTTVVCWSFHETICISDQVSSCGRRILSWQDGRTTKNGLPRDPWTWRRLWN